MSVKHFGRHRRKRHITTDVVTVRVRRGVTTGRLIISSFSVIGSASPCTSLLVVNHFFGPLKRCLLRHGFVIVAVFDGIVVFKRVRVVK